MVGVDRAIEFCPGGVDDAFVGRAERVQDRDGFVARCFVDGQLDVGQDPVGMGVSDEERTVFAGGGGGELVTVDQSYAGFDRVDAETRPRHVEERHGRSDVADDVVAFLQVAHRAFEHHGRARHGVQDLAVLDSSGGEGVGDLVVHLVERVDGVVKVVERDCVGHDVGRRVDRGAQVAMGGPFDRLERLDGDVVATAGAETDHHDARSLGWVPLDLGHGQPNGMT